MKYNINNIHVLVKGIAARASFSSYKYSQHIDWETVHVQETFKSAYVRQLLKIPVWKTIWHRTFPMRNISQPIVNLIDKKQHFLKYRSKQRIRCQSMCLWTLVYQRICGWKFIDTNLHVHVLWNFTSWQKKT